MKTCTSEPSTGPRNCEQSRRRGKGDAGDEQRFEAPLKAFQEEWQIKHILVPTDFSKCSIQALRYAVILAGKIGSQITLLNVIEPLPVDSEYPITLGGCDARLAEADDSLRTLSNEHCIPPSLIRNALIREGSPHQEIIAAAKDLQVDLIIIATRGHTGLAHVLLGSTAEKVVRHSTVPVFTVRPVKFHDAVTHAHDAVAGH